MLGVKTKGYTIWSPKDIVRLFWGAIWFIYLNLVNIRAVIIEVLCVVLMLEIYFWENI